MTPLQLKEILRLPVLVVLDEAYIEFSDVPSKVKLCSDTELLVVRAAALLSEDDLELPEIASLLACCSLYIHADEVGSDT